MAKSTLGITVCLLVIGACQIVADSPCLHEEEWKTCGDHLTCDNVLEYKKGEHCFRGCFCKGKKIRDKKGDCVPLHDCDKPIEDECPKNERFTRCGGNVACHPTCGKTEYECPQSCKSGCICNPGYFRRYLGGECIPSHECPYHHREIPLHRGVYLSGHSGKSNTNDSALSIPTQPQSAIQEYKNRTRRDAQCRRNEIFSKCGGNPRCEDFCNNDKIIVCPEICRSGCVCKQGYIRNVKGGACIPENKCPVVHRCHINEIYATCGGNQKCEDYCNRKGPLSCPLSCYPGCSCKEGYVRNVPGGVCIPKNQCPMDSGSSRYSERGLRKRRDHGRYYIDSKVPQDLTIGPYKPFDHGQCGPDGKYDRCGASCSLTCENHEEVLKCPWPCKPGCVCKPGLVRNAQGQCVTPENCPKALPAQPECGDDEHWLTCGFHRTCENHHFDQQFERCFKGCFCRFGYARNKKGICIPIKECEKGSSERPDCFQRPESGPCMANMPRFYFEKDSGECKSFTYGGCQGNSNNFRTVDECQRKCGSPSKRPDCSQPPETGPCMANAPRFYFDKYSGECKSFVYGGCKGNSNNFRTADECQRKCGRHREEPFKAKGRSRGL